MFIESYLEYRIYSAAARMIMDAINIEKQRHVPISPYTWLYSAEITELRLELAFLEKGMREFEQNNPTPIMAAQDADDFGQYVKAAAC